MLQPSRFLKAGSEGGDFRMSQKEDNKLSLTIESTSGSIQRSYNIHESIHAIKISAMAELHIDPSTERNYRLYVKGKNEPLPDDKKLSELALSNGMVLVLSPMGAEVI